MPHFRQLFTVHCSLTTDHCRIQAMDLKRVDKVFRVLPSEDRYYAYFDQLVGAVVEGCELLCRFLSEGTDPVATVAQLKAAERRGDDLTREIIVQLTKSFVTPIDRE